jgi:hypothetical protein
VSWGGTQYFSGTVEEIQITAIPLTLSLDPFNWLVRGEFNDIGGRVYAEELIPEQDQVRIFLDGQFLGDAFTNNQGRFNCSYFVPESSELREVQIDYYLLGGGVSSSQSCVIALRPDINYVSTGVGTWKDPFSLVFEFQDDHGEPLPYQNLVLETESEKKNLSTDGDGKGFYQAELDSRPTDDLFLFRVNYNGSRHIIPVEVSGLVKLVTPINYLHLILGLIPTIMKLGVAIAIFYIMYNIIWKKYAKPRIPQLQAESQILEDKEEVELPITTGAFIVKSIKGKITVDIPEIKKELPYVWGVSEPFTIKVKIKTNASEQVRKIQVTGFDDIKELILEGKDSATKKHFFQEQGLKVIEFSYENTKEGIYALTLLKLKIVEYRQEIIQQFKKDFQTQVERREFLSDKITAREMLNRLSSRLDSQSVSALERMVYNFEEANYSQHMITSENYSEYMLSRNMLEVEENIH